MAFKDGITCSKHERYVSEYFICNVVIVTNMLNMTSAIQTCCNNQLTSKQINVNYIVKSM